MAHHRDVGMQGVHGGAFGVAGRRLQGNTEYSMPGRHGAAYRRRHRIFLGCVAVIPHRSVPSPTIRGRIEKRGTDVTTGEWIVVGLFVGGLGCSFSLLWWLLRIVQRDKDKQEKLR
jgi:hypothetical protein